MFVGTFTAGKLRIAVDDGKLSICDEAQSRKFVDAVEHVTFSGDYARRARPAACSTSPSAACSRSATTGSN